MAPREIRVHDHETGSIELLTAEYAALREDERQWNGRAISLGSLYLVVVATTAFFLLREGHQVGEQHEVGHAVNPAGARYSPGWAYMAAPVPSFCITAMLARQAVTSTIRGRLLSEIEEILGRSVGTFALAGDLIPLRFSYRAQQLWLRGWRGQILAVLEGAPLLIIVGLCYSSINLIHEEFFQWVAVGLYTVLGVALSTVALPGITQTLFGTRSKMLKRTTLSRF